MQSNSQTTSTEDVVKSVIAEVHSGDEMQLEFILSDSSRIIVEGPAGYGKTRTMIGKIAYQLATNQIPNPKKILALTFSVNAAYKIKKDVTEQLPKILDILNQKYVSISDQIFVSNYHGLCRRLLKRYGYKLHPNLKNVDIITTFDDGSHRSFQDHVINLDVDNVAFLNQFSKALKRADKGYLRTHFKRYNSIYLDNLLAQNFISFNAILSLSIQLLHEYPIVKSFYSKLFPTIYIDEFQDTNLFSYAIIRQLINNESKVFLMGDPLQRIYGFIGAIPDLMNSAKDELGMDYIALGTNYRFRDNEQMLLLDYNVRRNAESLVNPDIDKEASIELTICATQDDEAGYIYSKSLELIEEDEKAKVAILFRGGVTNKNTLNVIEKLSHEQVHYFYGLFSDEDQAYREFHIKGLRILNRMLGEKKFSRRLCRSLKKEIEEEYSGKSSMHDSLLQLIDIFISRLFNEYYYLEEEEKVVLMKETLESFGLKQYMEYVESRIVVSTIHGAKGLEWDYVMMPDMEQYSLPSWFGACEECEFKNDCSVVYSGDNEGMYLDELSVFYVGFTRAKKQVFFSASETGLTFMGEVRSRNLSCFLKLKGITF